MAATLLADIFFQLFDGNGDPYPGWKLYSYAAGTDTPQATYSDVDRSVPNANPTVADADGRLGPCFLLSSPSYKFVCKDADDVTVVTRDNVGSPGDQFAENFGDAQIEGASFSVTSGYTITASNYFVTVAASGATTLNFPAVGTRTQPVAVKNVGSGTVVCTPNGANTFENSLATITIEAASTPLFPCYWFFPDSGNGTWWVFASHRAA